MRQQGRASPSGCPPLLWGMAWRVSGSGSAELSRCAAGWLSYACRQSGQDASEEDLPPLKAFHHYGGRQAFALVHRPHVKEGGQQARRGEQEAGRRVLMWPLHSVGGACKFERCCLSGPHYPSDELKDNVHICTHCPQSHSSPSLNLEPPPHLPAAGRAQPRHTPRQAHQTPHPRLPLLLLLTRAYRASRRGGWRAATAPPRACARQVWWARPPRPRPQCYAGVCAGAGGCGWVCGRAGVWVRQGVVCRGWNEGVGTRAVWALM